MLLEKKMDSKLKEILIKKIMENVPENIKPVNHITDILDLSKESVYRRLNGQLDFTLAEIVKLSSALNFSLDNIHSQYDENIATFHFFPNRLISAQETVQSMLQSFYNRMVTVYNATEKHTDIAINRIIGSLILHYPHLYRFNYYKWMHQFDNVPLNYYFKEVEFTENILNLIQQASYYQQRLEKTVIIDENIVYNAIQEVKYFQDRGLINNEEIALLKQDFYTLLERFEQILNTGENSVGTKWEVYLSSVTISVNTSCLNYDERVSSSYWMHSDATFSTSDRQVYLLQKEWMASLKKYSTLITQSNQKMQADFLNQQYKYLEEL
jgi:hypothetical protein